VCRALLCDEHRALSSLMTVCRGNVCRALLSDEHRALLCV